METAYLILKVVRKANVYPQDRCTLITTLIVSSATLSREWSSESYLTRESGCGAPAAPQAPEKRVYCRAGGVPTSHTRALRVSRMQTGIVHGAPNTYFPWMWKDRDRATLKEPVQ